MFCGSFSLQCGGHIVNLLIIEYLFEERQEGGAEQKDPRLTSPDEYN